MKKIISFIIIFQLLFIILILNINQSTSGQFLEPTVELSFIEYQKNAEYSGEYAEVRFDGIANVTIKPSTRVIVSLSALDTWGSAIVSPSNLQFDENGVKSFGVSVRVPAGEKYNSEGQVRVYGSWHMYPGSITGDCEPIFGTIIVKQYYNFSLSSKDSEIEAAKGSKTEFKLTITNNGNNKDTFSIDLKNDDDLRYKDFDVDLSSTSIELPMGFSETITISVQTPTKRDVLSENEIIIEVYSDSGIEHDVPAKEHEFKIKLRENESSIPKIFSIVIFLFVILIIVLLITWLWRKRRKKDNIK